MDKTVLIDYLENQVRWYGQSTIRIVTQTGRRLLIDPFRPLPIQEPLDMIMFTHSHRDHFNRDVLKTLRGTTTKVVGSGDLELFVDETFLPGQTRDYGWIKVRAVHAYNSRGFPHAAKKNWLGYVIDVDGLRLYHAGDTDVVPDAVALGGPIDVAFLPAVGFVSFNSAQAVAAALVIEAKVACPIHYGVLPGTAKHGQKFASAFAGVGNSYVFQDARYL